MKGCNFGPDICRKCGKTHKTRKSVKRKVGAWITKICPSCNKPFESWAYRNKEYCSNECRNKNKKTIKKCLICGKSFETYVYRNEKFCSRKCAGKNPERIKAISGKNDDLWETKPCPICGKVFSSYIIHHTIFCSMKCKVKSQTKNNITKVCPVCNKYFICSSRSHQKYCSIICRNKKNENTYTKIKCPVCGKEFVVKKKSHRKFCSRQCASKSPETGLKISNTKKQNPRHYSDEEKKKLSEQIKKLRSDPNSIHYTEEYREGQRRKSKDRWCDPKYICNSPEYRELRKQIWKDPNSVYRSESWKIKNALHLRNIVFKRPTKPQIKLFFIIRYLYPNNKVVFEQQIENLKYSIDVALPEIKMGFEYDEPYWHKHKHEKDIKRHSDVMSCGWTLIHYQTEKELKSLVPLEVWEYINKKIKKSSIEERCVMISNCL